VSTELDVLRNLVEWSLKLIDDGLPAPFSAGTAVVWVAATDDALMSQPTYRGRRDKHPDGQVIDGLRLARNAVVHGAVLATESEGLKFPLEYPMDFGPMVWVAYERLTAQWQPMGKLADLTVQRAAYEAHVSRQELRVPVARALSWFDEVRERGWVA